MKTGRSLLTGMVLGTMIKESANSDSLFKILDVRPVLDSNGDYRHLVEVDMPSGTYTIAVLDELVISEEP